MPDVVPHRRCWAWAIVAIVLTAYTPLAFARPSIGVYYFPGWKVGQPGLEHDEPWDAIKPYPEREPLLGWYPEGDVAVVEKQIEWMHKYGVDFVVYDWYWSSQKAVLLGQALAAFRQARNKNLLKYSLLWANHSDVPGDMDQFVSMVQRWVDEYFADEQFLTIQGRPAVFVFSASRLRENAQRFGKTSKDLLDTAQLIARQAGLPGIFFVAGMENESPEFIKYARDSGYSAITSYNYHATRGSAQGSHSFLELDHHYRAHWNWAVNNRVLPYFVPMTAGWNRKPWGGSEDAQHDNSVSTPALFYRHLIAAKQIIDRWHVQTMGMGLICCWNEYGEGSYIEPTRIRKFEYLDQVRKVFGSPGNP